MDSHFRNEMAQYRIEQLRAQAEAERVSKIVRAARVHDNGSAAATAGLDRLVDAVLRFVGREPECIDCAASAR